MNGIDRETYLFEVVPRLGMDPTVVDLAEFLGVPVEEAKRRAEAGAKDAALRASWKAEPPAIDEAAIRRFYRDHAEGYLYSHALADRYYYGKYEAIRPHLIGPRVLDYGAGNGTLALLLARLGGFEVTAADLPSPHFDFARFRFRKYADLSIEGVEIPDAGYPRGRWNTILALDVLEHVADWRGFLRWSADSANRLVLRVAFDLYDDGALHIADRTGLTADALLAEAEAAGLAPRVRDEARGLFVFAR